MAGRYETWIGSRYVRSRSRNSFVSLISAISMLGIAIAVLVLIVVMSVVNGFERELQERLLAMGVAEEDMAAAIDFLDGEGNIIIAGRTDADETSYETLSGGAQILSGNERELTYYNISLGYNVLPGEAFIGSGHAFNSALYVIAGVGNTEFANDSHFTVNVGAGYRFLLNDWIALHLDFRDHIFDSDLLGNDKTTHNLEGTAGVTLFF